MNPPVDNRAEYHKIHTNNRTATLFTEKKYDPGREIDQDSTSSVSDSDYSTENEDEPRSRRIPRVRMFVRQITDQIRSLYDISSLLRRPVLITEKSICSNIEEIEVTDLLGYYGYEDIRWFRKRMARAKTRRREQLLYWKNYSYESQQMITRPNMVGDKGIERHVIWLEAQRDDSQTQGSSVKPPDLRILHEGSESVSSKQTVSIVTLTDVYYALGTQFPKIQHLISTVNGHNCTFFVPDPPRMRIGETSFLCRYCGMTLASRDMDTVSWE